MKPAGTASGRAGAWAVFAVFRPEDFALVLLAFAALAYWKLPPWLVVCSGLLLRA